MKILAYHLPLDAKAKNTANACHYGFYPVQGFVIFVGFEVLLKINNFKAS
jgi:hypothetical protein